MRIPFFTYSNIKSAITIFIIGFIIILFIWSVIVTQIQAEQEEHKAFNKLYNANLTLHEYRTLKHAGLLGK